VSRSGDDLKCARVCSSHPRRQPAPRRLGPSSLRTACCVLSRQVTRRLTRRPPAFRIESEILPRVVPVETPWPRLVPICRPSHPLDASPRVTTRFLLVFGMVRSLARSQRRSSSASRAHCVAGAGRAEHPTRLWRRARTIATADPLGIRREPAPSRIGRRPSDAVGR